MCINPRSWCRANRYFTRRRCRLDGYGTGVIVKNREGHPIKVDGNPEHPASATWFEHLDAGVDSGPLRSDRSQSVTHFGEISDWGLFIGDLNELVREHEKMAAQVCAF